jgi:hypothetical protein
MHSDDVIGNTYFPLSFFITKHSQCGAGDYEYEVDFSNVILLCHAQGVA